jgi:hypothetical protein
LKITFAKVFGTVFVEKFYVGVEKASSAAKNEAR